MPLIYLDVGTTEDKMGKLNRKNLCIKAGDEDFVNQMISNWNLNNKMDQLFEERFNTSNNLLSEPVPLNGWSDSTFNCSISSDKLTDLKQNSLLKITFENYGEESNFKNFAIMSYQGVD